MASFGQKDLEDAIKNVKSETQSVVSEVQDVEAEVKNVKSEVQDVELETQNVKSEVQDVEADIETLQDRIGTTGQTVRDALDTLRASVLDDTGFARAHADGRSFVLDSTEFTVSDNLNLLVENPSGSGVTVTITKIVTFNGTDTAAFNELLQNPTNNTPSTARGTLNLSQTSAADTVQPVLKADDMANAMTAGDGTATGVELTVKSGESVEEWAYTLAPGESVGVGGLGGDLTSPTIKFSVTGYQASV